MNIEQAWNNSDDELSTVGGISRFRWILQIEDGLRLNSKMCTNWMNWQLVGIMGEFIVEPNNGVLDESVSSGNLVTSQYRRKLHFMKRKMLARFKISIQMQREISNFNSNAKWDSNQMQREVDAAHWMECQAWATMWSFKSSCPCASATL